MGKLARCESSGKLKFPTNMAAIGGALRSSRRRGTPLRTYFHQDCKSWHLTSRPRK